MPETASPPPKRCSIKSTLRHFPPWHHPLLSFFKTISLSTNSEISPSDSHSRRSQPLGTEYYSFSDSFNLAIEDNQPAINSKSRSKMCAGGSVDEDYRWPPWLNPLLNEKFFGRCQLHVESHKSECNLFCLDCVNGAFCSVCLAKHKGHNYIQKISIWIRRSSYHDVIRVNEIQKVVDISGIQTYIINSAKVVFLNERPQQRPGKGVTYTCEVCDRSLVDSFRFCSLGCKIAGTSRDFQKKPKINLHSAVAETEDSYSSSTSHERQLKQKPRSFSPTTQLSVGRVRKRRKGIPHRSPFGSSALDW